MRHPIFKTIAQEPETRVVAPQMFSLKKASLSSWQSLWWSVIFANCYANGRWSIIFCSPCAGFFFLLL